MLSPDQQNAFEQNGYLVVPDVLTSQELAHIQSEYAQLLEGLYHKWFKEGRVKTAPETLDFWQKLALSYEAGCDWFQPLDISLPGDQIFPDTPMHFGPAVFAMITHKRVLKIVEDLIGPEITSNPIQHVRIKPPSKRLAEDEIRAHITKTDWHQDRGVALEEADQTDMITVWVAITDATQDNGCLKVIPGKHKKMLPHCPKTQTAIADGWINESDAKALPVKAGSLVILHPLIPHASLPNHTNGFRWSFDLRYNVTGQPTGRSHFPDFIAYSQSQPERVLQDWKEWRGLWETARRKLSKGEHIPIHRWQSDAPFCA